MYYGNNYYEKLINSFFLVEITFTKVSVTTLQNVKVCRQKTVKLF